MCLLAVHGVHSRIPRSYPLPTQVHGLGIESGGFGTYSPKFRTPRSVEIRPGTVFSADFVRNLQTRYLLNIDENHTGDIRYFNKATALQAISATSQSFNCGVGTDPRSIQCAINAGA